MTKPLSLPSSKLALPEGVEATPLDTALVISRLRELYRKLKFQAECSPTEDQRLICFQVMHELEQLIEGHARQRQCWEAARDDLIRELTRALGRQRRDA